MFLSIPRLLGTCKICFFANARITKESLHVLLHMDIEQHAHEGKGTLLYKIETLPQASCWAMYSVGFLQVCSLTRT